MNEGRLDGDLEVDSGGRADVCCDVITEVEGRRHPGAPVTRETCLVQFREVGPKVKCTRWS